MFEHRKPLYGEEVYPHEPEIGLRYGEDAMFLTLQAWSAGNGVEFGGMAEG